MRTTNQFNLELVTEGERGLFQKLKCDGRFVSGEQPVKCGAIGLHAAGEFGARHFSALHLALYLPGNNALERTSLAFGK